MIFFNWQPLGVYRRPAGNDPWLVTEAWLVAFENIPQSVKYLRLKTTGRWTAMSGLPECAADGLVGQTFPPDRLFVADCAVGALIGRVGGSSATLKGGAMTVAKSGAALASDGGDSKSGAAKADATGAKAADDLSKPFAVGSHTVIQLPEDVIGPLFVSFNILLRPVSVRTLEITIESSS